MFNRPFQQTAGIGLELIVYINLFAASLSLLFLALFILLLLLASEKPLAEILALVLCDDVIA